MVPRRGTRRDINLSNKELLLTDLDLLRELMIKLSFYKYFYFAKNLGIAISLNFLEI